MVNSVRPHPIQYLNAVNSVISYIGANPTTPPNMIASMERAPTINDYQNVIVGDYWLFDDPTIDDTNPDKYQLWILVDLPAGQGIWKRFTFGGSAEAATEFPTDNGIAFPDINGVLNVFGGDNINTEALPDLGNNVYVNLNHSLHMPVSSADGTQGVWFTGATGFPLSLGTRFINNFGVGNTFVGSGSGNLGLTSGSAQNNSGFGDGSLENITTGARNTALGATSLNALSTQSDDLAIGASAMGSSSGSSNIAIGNFSGDILTGSFNTLVGHNSASASTTTARTTTLGYQSAQALTLGNDNTLLGYQSANSLLTGFRDLVIGSNAGSNLIGGESDNIIIGSEGQIGDSHTTRIGVSGIGNFQQSRAFMGGIYDVTVSGPNPKVVVVDENDQLGVSDFSPGGIKKTVFTTSGTWTKDIGNPIWIKVIGWNGGGGGGSGQATGSDMSGNPLLSTGGGGGGGGGAFIYESDAIMFGATETVTIGLGGIGGVGKPHSTNSLQPGGDGGITYFGTLSSPTAAIGGTGGTSLGFGTSGVGGPSGKIYTYAFTSGIQQGTAGGTGGNGVFSSVQKPTNIGGPSNIYLMSTAGGGGGGSVGVAPSASVGGSGGDIVANDNSTVIIAGGSGGGLGVNGSTGNTFTTSNYLTGGTGGGGGGGISTFGGPVGSGADGAQPGGGGGGGAGITAISASPNASGSGGNGGDGMVIVYEYF